MPAALSPDAKWEPEGITVTGGRNHGGGPGHKFNNHRAPQGVLIRPQDTIFLADTLNHSVIKRKPKWRRGKRFAGKSISGYGPELLCRPAHIVFHKQSNTYLICDRSNWRIVRKPPELESLLETLIEDVDCTGVAVDNAGSIYVSDSRYHVVRKYDADGSHPTEVAGGYGQGGRLKQLNHPTFLYVAPDQTLYVSDSGNNRVVKWVKGAKDGVVVAGGNGKGKNLDQLDYPTGFTVDPSGTVYVADHWNHRVMRWTADAEVGTMIVGNEFLSGDTTQHLNCPQGLGFDEKGNLYVADSGNQRVQKFSIKK